VAGCRENGSDPSDTMKDGDSLDYLSKYQLPKNVCSMKSVTKNRPEGPVSLL
jgi:hypothetical protein